MTARRADRTIALACILAGFFVSLAGVAIAAAPPKIVGTVAAVLNEVRIKLVGVARPRPAVVRQRLALGEQVQTGERGRMQALLLDRSAFTVGPNTRLTIDRFVYDPAGSSFSASIAKGAMRFMSGGRNRAGTRSISTPTASLGIRGTVVDTIVGEEAIAIARRERELGADVGGDPASASLIVLRGPGPRVQGDVAPGAVSVTAAGRTVELDRPMLAAYVPGPGVAPIGPFTISRPGLARINDLILPPIEAQQREPGEDPYLQRRNNRPYSRLRPDLPGLVPQDQPRPDVVRPGDVPIFQPDDVDPQGPGAPPPNSPGPNSPPPGSNYPGNGP
jgi:FecR protein